MQPDFSSAHALLRRANYHIDEFESGAKAFVGKNPYTLIDDYNPDTGLIDCKIRVTQEIPDYLAIDAFEIVNALRSCLDHAVYDAVIIMTGNASPKYTKFPFGKTKEDVERDLQRKNSQIPDCFGKFLIDFQPYEGGNPVLADLNEVRNGKIHRTLTPNVLASQGIGIGSGYVEEIHFHSILSEWNSAKQELTYMRLEKPAKGQFQLNVTIAIAMGEGTAQSGKTALEFFRASFGEVTRIVSAVEAETTRIIASR